MGFAQKIQPSRFLKKDENKKVTNTNFESKGECEMTVRSTFLQHPKKQSDKHFQHFFVVVVVVETNECEESRMREAIVAFKGRISTEMYFALKE